MPYLKPPARKQAVRSTGSPAATSPMTTGPPNGR